RSGDILQFIVAMLCILALIAALGTFLESKRHWWTAKIGLVLRLISNYTFSKPRYAGSSK
ncbi:MAG: hypothetical protein ABIX01_21310, partial [Chitinophagaceae bacterium]